MGRTKSSRKQHCSSNTGTRLIQVIQIPHLNGGLNHGGSAGFTNGHKGGDASVLHNNKGEH